MKIFLTGASGMLAAEVIPKLRAHGHEVLASDLRPRLASMALLDITNLNQIKKEFSRTQPDYVFHLAAETDVDLCEQRPDHAFRVNTLGTENIALACQQWNIPLLYISTAGVFSGEKKEPYTEFDTPHPANVYGRSKWQGEIIVRDLLSRHYIIRAGWMVGGWEIDKKFVYKIVHQILEGKKELRVVADKFGSPTFTKDFARNLMTVIETNRYGLYHMTNTGTCSRYEVAVKIVELMNLKDDIKVLPISSDEFPLPAPRARSEMMRNYKLELLGLNHMPHWQESLAAYIQAHTQTLRHHSN